MYYLSKGVQGLGLILILIGFIRNYPELMSPKILIAGMIIFFCGWLIQRTMLRS